MSDGIVCPKFGPVCTRKGREVQCVPVHDFDVIARVASVGRWVVVDVGGHPCGTRGVIVRPQFCPVIIGVRAKEKLCPVLDGQQITGETASGPLTDVGDHPHLVCGGVVTPQLVAVDAVIGSEIEGVLYADLHSLVRHWFTTDGPRTSIVDEADPLFTAVRGLVVNFTGFEETVPRRSTVVAVIQTKRHQSPTSRTSVGFAEANGIAEHHFRCASALRSILTVGAVAHIDGFIDFSGGQKGVMIVIDAHLEANATTGAHLAWMLDEGSNEGALAVHAIGPVGAISPI